MEITLEYFETILLLTMVQMDVVLALKMDYHWAVAKGWNHIGIVIGGLPSNSRYIGIYLEGHPNWDPDGITVGCGSRLRPLGLSL